jgi:hypothetical protein
MATKATNKKAKPAPVQYVSQLETVSIKAISRVSCKLRDNYYTFEFQEERQIPVDVIDENFDLQKEKELLWEEVHAQVDLQVQEITALYANGNR